MRQSRVAEPRSQLEALLERLLIVVLLRRGFDDNCVVSFTNFVPLLGLGPPFLWDLDELRSEAGSETNFAKSSCKNHSSSARLLFSNEYSTTGMATDLVWWARGGVLRYRSRRVRRHILQDSAQPVDDVVVVHLISGHP
jgi:hypothetical protein